MVHPLIAASLIVFMSDSTTDVSRTAVAVVDEVVTTDTISAQPTTSELNDESRTAQLVTSAIEPVDLDGSPLLDDWLSLPADAPLTTAMSDLDRAMEALRIAMASLDDATEALDASMTEYDVTVSKMDDVSDASDVAQTDVANQPVESIRRVAAATAAIVTGTESSDQPVSEPMDLD